MKLNSDRAREIGRMGGQASARSRRARRGMRETLLTLLAEDETHVFGEDTSTLTTGEAIARGLIRQAAEGNIKAAEFIRDTIGEKPGTKAAAETASSGVHEIRIRVVE